MTNTNNTETSTNLLTALRAHFLALPGEARRGNFDLRAMLAGLGGDAVEAAYAKLEGAAKGDLKAYTARAPYSSVLALIERAL
jgi:hypothetical protein